MQPPPPDHHNPDVQEIFSAGSQSATNEVVLYFERLRILRAHPYLPWIILGLSLSAGCLIVFVDSGDKALLGLCLPYFIGTALIPQAIRVAYNIIRNWQGQLNLYIDWPLSRIDQWFGRHLGGFGSYKLMATVGFVVTLMSLGAHMRGGVFESLSIRDTNDPNQTVLNELSERAFCSR